MIFFHIIGYINENSDVENYIQSLININYTDYKIVIIDETINMNSDKYSKYKNIDKISFVRQKGFRGMYNSINYCLNSLEAEYIIITTANIFLNSNILKYLNNTIIKTKKEVYQYKLNNSCKHNFLNICFNRKIINNIGYFDTYNMFSDWDFFIRITKIYKVHNINLIMGNIQKSDNIDSSSIKFKKTMTVSTRLYINYKNYIKYKNDDFYSNIYSPLDIIIKDVSEVIKCEQNITIILEGEYYLINKSNKNNLSITDTKMINNIKIINNNKKFLKPGNYTLNYTLEKDILDIKPIILHYTQNN